MRKVVLMFGSIAGALAVALFAVTFHFMDAGAYGTADFFGYAALVLSALVVFFGIRSYRETAGGGRLAFGRGVAVGVLITLVASACYIVAFQLAYFKLVPGLGEKYATCMVDRVRASGADPRKIDETTRQAQFLKQMWDRPVTNAAVSFAESFPIGLVAALMSAAILRKR